MAILMLARDERDQIRLPEFYDPVFEYLVSLGIGHWASAGDL